MHILFRAAVAGAAATFLAAATAAAPAAPSLPHALVAERAALAARALLAAQTGIGLFDYAFDFVLRESPGGDSIVRQSAAAAVLADYLHRSGISGLAAPSARALRALTLDSVAFAGGALVSDSDGVEDGSAGATAFALMAVTDYRAATGDRRFDLARTTWLRGLAALQLPSGGFAKGPGSEEESSYYNGESWLAFARVAADDPKNPTAAAALARAEPYLIERYARAPDVQFAHWGLMAAGARYATTREPRYLDFIEKLADGYLTDVRPALKPEVNGCYVAEGLAAAALALSEGGRAAGPLYATITTRLDAELKNSLDMQILTGTTRLDLGRKVIVTAPELQDYVGAFLSGRWDGKTRIDYTQHCLSALMRYDDLLRNAATR